MHIHDFLIQLLSEAVHIFTATIIVVVKIQKKNSFADIHDLVVYLVVALFVVC